MLSLTFVTLNRAAVLAYNPNGDVSALFTLLYYDIGAGVRCDVLFLEGCTQACRHGAVFRRKGCRVDRPVASALWTLGPTSTGTVRSDSQTLATLPFSHQHTRVP